MHPTLGLRRERPHGFGLMDLMVGWMSKRCDRINDLMDVLYVCTYGYMNVWMTLCMYTCMHEQAFGDDLGACGC